MENLTCLQFGLGYRTIMHIDTLVCSLHAGRLGYPQHLIVPCTLKDPIVCLVSSAHLGTPLGYNTINFLLFPFGAQ
jgi:hypothetical protein